ncbi:hypothetical protein FACS189475_08260 [Betaproteobacteria bacterium]|nr:hypothetical protein FACS189475_08260 [Betaproteobacteria bacterium]
MTPSTLIRNAQTDGVKLFLSPSGSIKATGEQEAVNRWLPTIREHKTRIIEALKTESEEKKAWRWYLEFPDRDPVTVSFSPEATRAQIIEWYPDALAAEPCVPVTGKPDTLGADDERSIRAWLSSIGESDQSIADVVIDECRADPQARDYFLGRAGEAGADPITIFDDDRRSCSHCLNLQSNGACKVASPGGLVSAAWGYRPNQEWLQRCAGYRPCPDDPDQRPGAERWPEYAGANT